MAKKYNIYFIPFEIRGPIYLELLKANIDGESKDGDIYKVNRFSWKHLFFTRAQKDERRVIHIHWETNVYGSKYLIVSLAKMIIKFPTLWLLKKLHGIKIVWTRHNLQSHDYPHPKSDDFGRVLMYMIADKVLFHENVFAISETKSGKHTNIECIPPGNYINVYGPLWSVDRDAIRAKYGLSKDKIVLLALGAVRPYKALEPLIESVIEVTNKGVPVELFVMGRAPKDYGDSLIKLVGGNKNIILNLTYFADEDTAELHGLADYSALYYGESALGSAAILLSLSYGVPVISRDFAVSELVEEGKNGFKFHDKNGLIKVLEKLPQIPKFDKQQVISTVSDWGWKEMGDATRKAYTSLYK